MSTTTKKHSSFVNEPMEGKHVTEVPGIGVVLGERLSDKGFKTVSSGLLRHINGLAPITKKNNVFHLDGF